MSSNTFKNFKVDIKKKYQVIMFENVFPFSALTKQDSHVPRGQIEIGSEGTYFFFCKFFQNIHELFIWAAREVDNTSGVTCVISGQTFWISLHTAPHAIWYGQRVNLYQ